VLHVRTAFGPRLEGSALVPVEPVVTLPFTLLTGLDSHSPCVPGARMSNTESALSRYARRRIATHVQPELRLIRLAGETLLVAAARTARATPPPCSPPAGPRASSPTPGPTPNGVRF
jgi:hypothetical protein